MTPRTDSSPTPLETSSVVLTPVSPAELAAQRRLERRRLNALTRRLSRPPDGKGMGKFVNHSPRPKRRRVAPTPTKTKRSDKRPSAAASDPLTLSVPFASVSVASAPSVPLSFAGNQALLTPTLDDLDAPLTPGVVALLDQIAQETDTATATIAVDPISNQVSVDTLAEEIFSKVVLPRIQASSQFELLNSYRVDFFRQHYEQALKLYLSANYFPMIPVYYAQLDNLIVQALAFLGIQ